MGNLTPILTLECVPGDKFELGCESLIRFAPMIAPVMHRMDVSMHYFFVPNRILWDNWEKFITGNDTEVVAPYVPYTTNYVNGDYPTLLPTNKFLDYMGVPTIPIDGESQNLNALPFAAYQCIYNEFYRDQNLIAPVDYKLTDGNQLSSVARIVELLTLRKRAWEHDYFTASLPFAQKGAAVDIPLGTISTPASKIQGLDTAGTSNNVQGVTGTFDIDPISGPLAPGLYSPAVTADVEPTTINDLRRAFRLQEWLEKNARGGTRYIESILTHFGVK